MRIKYKINFKKKNCIIHKGKNYVLKNSFKIIEHFNLEYLLHARSCSKSFLRDRKLKKRNKAYTLTVYKSRREKADNE